MITHNIPSRTSMDEVINQVEMDINATDREKFFVANIWEYISDKEDSGAQISDQEETIADLESVIARQESKAEQSDEEIANLKLKIESLELAAAELKNSELSA